MVSDGGLRPAPWAETVIIKLNGGLGTSMGMDKAKSLLQVRDGQDVPGHHRRAGAPCAGDDGRRCRSSS